MSISWFQLKIIENHMQTTSKRSILTGFPQQRQSLPESKDPSEFHPPPPGGLIIPHIILNKGIPKLRSDSQIKWSCYSRKSAHVAFIPVSSKLSWSDAWNSHGNSHGIWNMFPESWGYPNRCFLLGKILLEMDDLGVPPFQEMAIWFSLKPELFQRVLASFLGSLLPRASPGLGNQGLKQVQTDLHPVEPRRCAKENGKKCGVGVLFVGL